MFLHDNPQHGTHFKLTIELCNTDVRQPSTAFYNYIRSKLSDMTLLFNTDHRPYHKPYNITSKTVIPCGIFLFKGRGGKGKKITNHDRQHWILQLIA